MKIFHRFNQISLIYKINIVLFILTFVASNLNLDEFRLLWFFSILLLVLINVIGCIGCLFTALLSSDKEPLLLYAKYYFISLCMVLLIGIPICFLGKSFTL